MSALERKSPAGTGLISKDTDKPNYTTPARILNVTVYLLPFAMMAALLVCAWRWL